MHVEGSLFWCKSFHTHLAKMPIIVMTAWMPSMVSISILGWTLFCVTMTQPADTGALNKI